MLGYLGDEHWQQKLVRDTWAKRYLKIRDQILFNNLSLTDTYSQQYVRQHFWSPGRPSTHDHRLV